MAEVVGLDDAPYPEPSSRASGDEALYAHLVKVGFAGPDYQAVADTLARYAYPILYAWLASGQIVQECAHKGVHGIHRLAADKITLNHHDIDDLVQDTLITALDRFARAGRERRGWSPQGGAALRTYFISGCLFAFGDVYRRWERDHDRHAPHDPTALSAPSASIDPADLIVLRQTLKDALPPPGRALTAVLLNAAGYTHAQIARILGENTTSRAVEGLLHRHRGALKGGTQP
ncbi:DNA-directed RNA polymerase specialized sigma subunit, sigma24 family [Parafrankia irregularis]|uniref:DNA-directed RNA polymerase specialized sigma subunit, sigma24 family n=1 Tax=Parafrankia irregularis TaxID=795642 RepID=A0A0S4QR80_9ACTN|nr:MULTISPECIES: sigma-70 family RNA polymerase sigma factor [Parafrankia]MBE3201659.1 sigma-70 family RNA polymerase sigma factor [Parafrankia sp. CH37]CUU57400.1 DNA-directed RNA polymerase specialized sigma subunit, sigma24 family [Parafrankia irregularis]